MVVSRPSSVVRGGSPGGGRRTVALFLTFLGLYLLTASGHFYATDEETLFRATESLVERRTFAMPAGSWGIAIRQGTDGRYYPVTGPAQSLLAVPLYLVGKVFAPLFPAGDEGYILRFWATLLGSFVTAATVALLYRLARALGYSGRVALALALIYGLATTAWPHGRTFFAEPLTALCALLAFTAIRRGAAGGMPRWLLLAGAAAAASVAVKPQTVLVLPGLGLYLLLAAFDPALPRVDLRGLAKRLFRWGCWFGGGLALGATPLLIYNAILFGSPLTTGYGDGASNLFNTPFLTGLYGLTVSTGKGLIWYSPPVMLAIVGWWPFFRRHRAEAVACLALVATHLAFYSRFTFWHGDGAWGPRYLMTALPFAVLPALGLLGATIADARLRALRRGAVGVVVVAGVTVQLLGLLVNFDWYILRSAERDRHFLPAASPLIVHARYLGQRIDEWRERAFPPPDTAILTNGFAPAEPIAPEAAPAATTSAALFPRWTTGAGEITLHPARAESLTVKITFFDHRPTAARDTPAVLVNGTPLPESAVERQVLTADGEGQAIQFVVPAEAVRGNRAVITLQSATWNPATTKQGERDEELGLFVHNVEVWRAGVPFATGQALPILRMLDTPRWRFWWFNDDRAPDDTRHHLVDHWAWYAAVAGFPRTATMTWIAAYGVIALVPLVVGLGLGWRALPVMLPLRRSVQKRGKRKRTARTKTGVAGTERQS